MVNPGKRDRLIRIEQAVRERTSTGAFRVVEWVPFAMNVWAEVRALRGVESQMAQQLAAKVDTVFDIDFLAALSLQPNPSETLRLVCDGRIHDIQFVQEMGRRASSLLFAQARAEKAA